MQDVKALQEKINTLEQRREELQSDAKGAAADLKEAQSDLIEGVEGADERATRAQARVTSIGSTIQALEDRLGGLRLDLEEARKKIDHTERIEQLAELAQEAVEADKLYNATRQEIAKQFEAAADVMQDASTTVQEARRRFRKLRQSLDLPDHEIMRRLQGADVSVVTAERIDPAPIPGKYAEVIGIAIRDAARITAREQIGRIPEPARA